MKNMKKLVSLMLALLLALALSISCVAEETELGSITINGISANSTYELYKLLDLESYNAGSGAYSYKVNLNWDGFFATEEALKYVAIDGSGYVTWIAANDDDTVAAFAKKALAYAEEHDIPSVQSSKNNGEFVITDASGKFSNLEMGYYLVDSTVGALCGLTTTNPDASINAKNGVPVIDKQVMEDSTTQWADANTADIGQIVEFRVTINVHAGAQNYVLHDTMGEGLTFQGVTNIQHLIPGNDDHEHYLDPEKNEYTVNTNVTHENGETCTFEVVFPQAVCDQLETNDKLIVHYKAMLNRNALIAGDGNPNQAKLEYGEGNYTTTDVTKTTTYGFDIVKTDGQNMLLDGASFKVYDALEGGNEVAVVPLMEDDDVTPVKDENGNQMYRRARANEESVAIPVTTGVVRVVGFDNGTYYLEEVAAPAGYNKLSARHKFIIADKNEYSIFNGNVYSTGSGIHVVNKTGTMLPETGGIGTTLFYVFGGILAVAAVVLLVTKKRMSGME